MNASRMLFLAIVVIVTAVWRVVPHTFHVVPTHALAVWAGACLIDRRKNWSSALACLLPLAAQLVSDIVIERTRMGTYYAPMLMVSVYCSLLASVAIGWLVNSRWAKSWSGPLWIAGAGVASWTTFFVLTNFAEWAFTGYYPRTLAGFRDCYIAAWLFDSGKVAGVQIAPLSMLGNLVFQGALFGTWALLPSRETESTTSTAAATN